MEYAVTLAKYHEFLPICNEGKAIFLVPYLGWVKFGTVQLKHWVGVNWSPSGHHAGTSHLHSNWGPLTVDEKYCAMQFDTTQCCSAQSWHLATHSRPRSMMKRTNKGNVHKYPDVLLDAFPKSAAVRLPSFMIKYSGHFCLLGKKPQPVLCWEFKQVLPLAPCCTLFQAFICTGVRTRLSRCSPNFQIRPETALRKIMEMKHLVEP